MNSRFDLAVSLAFEGHYHIDILHENTIDKAQYNGHYFMEKAPGVSYLTLPFTWLASQFITLNQVKDKYGDPLLHIATILTLSLLSALSAVYFKKILLIINPQLSHLAATFQTLIIYGGTLILPYSTMLFSHQLAGSLLVLGFYNFLQFTDNTKPISQKYYNGLWGVLLFGLSVLTEYPTVVLAIGLFLVCFLPSKNKSDFIKVAWIGTIPLLLFLIHNKLSFGSPFKLGYGEMSNTFTEGMSQGFFGVSQPSAENSVQLLFGTYRGLFTHSPLLVICIAGFFYWPKTQLKNIFLPLIISSLALLLIISGYSFWQGGVCWGPRHLVPIIPFLAMGIAHLPTRLFRHPISLVLIVVSFFYNILATATTPFVSERVLNPLVAYAEDFVFKMGRFAVENPVSLNPVGYTLPVEQIDFAWSHHMEPKFVMASYNMGEVLGLAGWTSVLPLALIWLTAVLAVVRLSRKIS
jgi:hypothetical protein